MTGQDTNDLIFRFFNEIHIIAQLSGNALGKAMPDGMTLPQFSVLNHLVRLGGNRTPLSIASAMQVSKGTMTNTLRHLEKSGSIIIRPDNADGRSKRIDVTEGGRIAHGRALANMVPALARMSETFADKQLASALPLLEEIRHVLDDMRN